jgi:hypothetical protein
LYRPDIHFYLIKHFMSTTFIYLSYTDSLVCLVDLQASFMQSVITVFLIFLVSLVNLVYPACFVYLVCLVRV